MELKFDKNGNLVPYERINITFQEFEDFFVKPFGVNSNRLLIFENYKKFIQDFSNEVSPNFTHWVNGSFVSSKVNPRDIDFVTFIPHSIYKSKRWLIDTKFRLKGAAENYLVDAYTVEILPESHKRYGVFKIDLVYWDHWFGKTKKNWAEKKFLKGYIEIDFGS